MSTYRGGIGATFVVSVLGSVGFAAAYALNAGAQWEGLGLFVALGALAIGILLWVTFAVPREEAVDVRDDYPSEAAERKGAEAAFQHGAVELDRNGFLLKGLLTAFGALGLAALFPLRSLGPQFAKGLFGTKWRRGAGLVRDDGTPVRVSDLEVGSILTVFPAGHVDDAASQAVLLRLPPGVLEISPERGNWSPQGYVAFSKVCTHAGCAVGLYRASAYQLLCPCHQSVFDVSHAARPVSGPAARALPQLPLQIAEDGYLQAQSDFTEPTGPGFWQRS
jgi:ubiquinol-cytochrome c reductase iron-sulfur subunit